MTASSLPLARVIRRAAGAARLAWVKARYGGTLNAPYLSGDLFRDCCDAAFDADPDTRAHFLSRLEGARSLFVKTDLVPEFFETFARRAEACRVLVSGNSDREIHALPAVGPPRLRRWFAQNTLVADQIVRPLPIGLENQQLGRNGLRRHFRSCSEAELEAKRVRLLAPFRPWTGERADLARLLAASPLADVVAGLSPRRMQQRVRQYRFVVAPRGGGIDTHRLWEALYGDAIPITRRTAWSAALREDGVPVVEVEDWDELVGWTADDLRRLSASHPRQPSALPWLWAPFWRRRIADLAAGDGSDSGSAP